MVDQVDEVVFVGSLNKSSKWAQGVAAPWVFVCDW